MATIDELEQPAQHTIDTLEEDVLRETVAKTATPTALPRTEGPPQAPWTQRLIETLVEPVPYKAINTALDVLAMPGDYTRGVLKGRPGERVDPWEFFGAIPGEVSQLQGAIRGGAGMLVDPLTFVGPLAGTVRRMLGPSVKPIVGPITPATSEFDLNVAQRVTPRMTAEPDWPAPGPRVDQTQNVLTVPALEPGSKTEQLMSDVYQMAKEPTASGMIAMERPEFASLTPGEYGPLRPRGLFEEDTATVPVREGQLSLLAEPPQGGVQVREPGEQLTASEVIIRPQVRRLPGFPAESTARAIQPITKVLQGMTYKERNLLSRAEADLIRSQPPPSDEIGVKLIRSPRGSVSVEPTGPVIEQGQRITLPELTEVGVADGAVFPSLPARALQSTTDTLKLMGPTGTRISSLLSNAYGNRATLSSNNVVDLTKGLDEILGRRSTTGRVKEGVKELTDGENAFVLGLHRVWNFTPEEVESLFNYMYTERRMTPLNDRVKQVGELLYKHGLEPASMHPGVRELRVWNPIQERSIPVGQPGMFMPQQPVHKATKDALRDRDMRILYEKAGGLEKTGLSYDGFRNRVLNVFSESGEVRAFKARGLENARLLDLEALGGSPYQWAKKLGYETDPYRAVFRYNTMATLRGEFKLIEPELERQLQALIESGNTYAAEWAKLAIDRGLLRHTGFEHTQWLHDVAKGLRDFNNVTLLQLGGIASVPQISYAVARGGLWRSILGTMDLLSGADRELVERSGALLPSLMNELLQPTGPLATVSTGALRAYGVSAVDKFSRYFAGHVGNRYVNFLEEHLLTHPSSARARGLVAELGVDPQAILQLGKVPANLRARMIQNFANMTAGVADVRGLPLGGLSESPWANMVRQYRTFAMNNAAEIRRQIKNAPTLYDAILRSVRLTVGAGLTGAAVHTISDYIWNGITGRKEKVNKPLAKQLSDEELGWIAESIVLGLGTVEGMLVLQAMDDSARAVAQVVGGPPASLAISAMKDIGATVNEGPGPKTFRTATRRIPFIGPVMRSLLQEEIDDQTRIEQKRNELRRSLKPKTGFENFE